MPERFLSYQGRPGRRLAGSVQRGIFGRPEASDLLYKIPSQPYNRRFFRGGIAQLGERLHGMQEVRGSIPRTSTSKSKDDFPGPHRLEAQDTTLSR